VATGAVLVDGLLEAATGESVGMRVVIIGGRDGTAVGTADRGNNDGTPPSAAPAVGADVDATAATAATAADGDGALDCKGMSDRGDAGDRGATEGY
jgi:hypothetical protein